MRCAATPRRRVVDLDGWTALSAFVPPKERRGLVLIDPPFEAKDEFERLAAGFRAAFQKWPTGSYLLWYPVKSRRAADTLAREVAQAAAARQARRRMPAAGIFRSRPQEAGGPLASTGPVDGQPALDVAGRAQDHPARAGKAARPGRRRPLPAGDAEAVEPVR